MKVTSDDQKKEIKELTDKLKETQQENIKLQKKVEQFVNDAQELVKVKEKLKASK